MGLREQGFDHLEYRRALGCFATGVTIMTIRDGSDQPRGITVSSFSSLSLEPPLVLWSIKRESHSYPYFREAKAFAVNILSSDQERTSRDFCLPIDRFATVEWIDGSHRLPLIQGCAAWIECAMESILDGGDHAILIGRVLRTSVFDRKPLLHWGGEYRAL